MQQLSRLINSPIKEDRYIAGEIIYKNLHIFQHIETLKNVEYIIWKFEYLNQELLNSVSNRLLTPKGSSFTFYIGINSNSLYYYPNTETHV